MKYAYLIKTNTSLGEGYEKISKWYFVKETCENNLIKSLNSNKLTKELINGEMFNCYVNVYLVTDEINNDNTNFITNYNIIKFKEKIIFDDGFKKKFSTENLWF